MAVTSSRGTTDGWARGIAIAGLIIALAGLGDAIRRGEALLYRVAPSTAFGFGKGTPYSQTRWTFA
jgi:hypothetical protein